LEKGSRSHRQDKQRRLAIRHRSLVQEALGDLPASIPEACAIGPTMAVADVRSDGAVYVYTHTQNPQALRSGIALMLATPVDHVVVRTFAGAVITALQRR